MSKLVAGTSNRTLSRINLRGIMVGNGVIDDMLQRKGTFEMGCLEDHGQGHILNQSQCKQVSQAAVHCQRATEICRASDYDLAVCRVSESFCMQNGWMLIRDTPWNPYDVRINCTMEPSLCEYPTPGLVEWLDSSTVRLALGADDDCRKFIGINFPMNIIFDKNGETTRPSHPWVTSLLDQGIRVLIYAGNTDWLCTAAGMRHLVDGLSWHGSASFQARPFLPLRRENIGLQQDKERRVGYYKQHSSLTFVEVDNAGHFVPAEQPEVALAMINRWIAREIG